MSEEPGQLALQLIERRRTMVLATADDGPWAAPVYYLWRNGAFHFFSSPKSRHIVQALESGRCAAAIFHDSDDWRDIEGLQMYGALEPAGAEAVAIFAAYVRRFPTVRGFFSGEFGLDEFLAKFRSRMYAFRPESVFYLNNRAGFGKRQEIQLPD